MSSDYSPAPLSTEADAIRAELSAQSGPGRERALRALRVLSEAAGASDEGPRPASDDLPAVPEKLRARWAEAFGVPVPAGRPAAKSREGAGEPGFFRWLVDLFTARPVAWGGGLAFAALAALMTAGFLNRESEKFVGIPEVVTTRGGAGQGGEEPARGLVFIVPEGKADALRGRLQAMFPGRAAQFATDAGGAHAAVMQAGPGVPTIVADTVGNAVSVWRNRSLVKNWPVKAGGEEGLAEVFSHVEDADEFLDREPSASPK